MMTCKSCKGTRQVQLLESMVECLDCRTPPGLLRLIDECQIFPMDWTSWRAVAKTQKFTPVMFGPSVNSVIQDMASRRVLADMLALQASARACEDYRPCPSDADSFDEEPDSEESDELDDDGDDEDEPLFTTLAYMPRAGDQIWMRPTRLFKLGQEVAMSLEEPWTIVAPTAFLPAVGTVVYVPPADSETRLVLVEIRRVGVQ